MRFRYFLALALWAFVAFVQSCANNSKPQQSNPPPLSQLTDTESEPVKHIDWAALASIVPPVKDKQPATIKLPSPRRPRALPPESVVGSPELDAVTTALQYDTVVTQRPAPVPGNIGWQYRKNRRGQIVGFEFSNRGGNRILTERHDIRKNRLYTRDFQFRFDDRAKQDIHLSLTDWTPSPDKQFRLSELMNSVLLFFPRNFVPAIANYRDSAVVVLPTGEAVHFDAKTHEVVGGAFAEAPVDLTTRRFPAVEYVGKGATVRANARGKDPRLGTVATITNNSPDSDCARGQRCNQCQVPAKELWEQNGAVRFRFSSDEAFDRYLRKRCGFGLPQVPYAIGNQALKN